MANEGQPGWPPGVRFGSVVLGENPPYHVFVDGDIKSSGNLLSNSRAAPGGIALLRLDNGLDAWGCVTNYQFAGDRDEGSGWMGPLLSLRADLLTKTLICTRSKLVPLRGHHEVPLDAR